ncbi:MAG: hypothetical protein IRZ03_00735 [Acidobacterium ailaaui]|jgi:hypothetical protein|nr:hypothetical protein [Pseudacidobacterium ailaaui]
MASSEVLLGCCLFLQVLVVWLGPRNAGLNLGQYADGWAKRLTNRPSIVDRWMRQALRSMCNKNCRFMPQTRRTMNIKGQAMSSSQRNTNSKVVEMMVKLMKAKA